MISLAQLNALTPEAFVNVVGPVFEHSPWIAEMTWKRRPFDTREELHRELCMTIFHAAGEQQVALIRAHPDLVGRAAVSGTLTKASAGEQVSAGLDRLTPAEIEAFQKFNAEYHAKFGFPFVICARLNKKEAILKGFEQRLRNTRDQEIKIALVEIAKIAWLRLCDLVTEQ